MSKSERISHLKRIIIQAEYRSLKPIEKAIKLVEEEEAFFTDAAEITGVWRKSIARAIQAKQENRDVGINGRPKIFTNVEMEQVMEQVKSIPTKERRAYNRIQKEVIWRTNSYKIWLTIAVIVDSPMGTFKKKYENCWSTELQWSLHPKIDKKKKFKDEKRTNHWTCEWNINNI